MKNLQLYRMYFLLWEVESVLPANFIAQLQNYSFQKPILLQVLP